MDRGIQRIKSKPKHRMANLRTWFVENGTTTVFTKSVKKRFKTEIDLEIIIYLVIIIVNSKF